MPIVIRCHQTPLVVLFVQNENGLSLFHVPINTWFDENNMYAQYIIAIKYAIF